MNADLLDRSRAYKLNQLSRELFESFERIDRDSLKLSAWRAITAAAQGRYRHLAPAEYEAWGTIDGNPQRFIIPFSYLEAQARRDLTTGNTYLTATTAEALAQPLAGAGLVRAGARVVPGVQQNSVQPYVSAKPSTGWKAGEGAALTTDTAFTLGQTSATLHAGGIDLKVSRQLQLQAADLEGTIDPLLNQLGADMADAGWLGGTGAAGQPLGAPNDSRIQSVSGAAANVSALSTMEEGCIGGDADDTRLTWFASPDVRRILRQRELTAGGGAIWAGSTLLGHRAIVSSKLAAATLLLGDFSNLNILLFGAGLEVLVNPFANFQSGAITLQLSLGVDYVVNYPGSFRKSTTIS
ncbi:MAG: phage major capsid protein [Nitrospira sp.]